MAESGQKTNVWLGLTLAVLLAPVGFVAGGVVAALTVTEMRLAAAGVYFGYMVIGAALGVLVGMLLAVALPYERLKRAVQGAVVLALLAAGVVAARAWRLHQKDAAARAEVAALQPAPPKPVLPPPDSLVEPPPPPAGQSAVGPLAVEAWRSGTFISVGLPATGRTPDVAFYYGPDRFQLPLTRDDAYYYGLMPAAQSTRPCGGMRLPALFGADARLDLGTLSPDAIERTVQAACETVLTAHGRGYARPATLSQFEVRVDRPAQNVCAEGDPAYVLWAVPDALPAELLLYTTLPHAGGPNAFIPADTLRVDPWPPSLHKGRFWLPEGAKVRAYAAYAYRDLEEAFLVKVTGTAPGGDEYPPVAVRYQAWFFVLNGEITPLLDNNPGGGCGPEEIDLRGVLDLTGDGDHDLVFGSSLMVLERHADGFRTRAAPRMPCRC